MPDYPQHSCGFSYLLPALVSGTDAALPKTMLNTIAGLLLSLIPSCDASPVNGIEVGITTSLSDASGASEYIGTVCRFGETLLVEGDLHATAWLPALGHDPDAVDTDNCPLGLGFATITVTQSDLSFSVGICVDGRSY